ncbi:MAG: nitrophenyl compound nitroreductase subunit ArsF family protein [Bacteroidales bacterium]
MKKIGIILLIMAIAALMPVRAVNDSSNGTDNPQVKKSNPVEVYYFHMTRRCVTCQTVEKVAEDAVKENFKDALAKGTVVFKSVNLEDKANKDLMKKLKVGGQSLLVVSGSEKIDITDKGFMYAVNEPDKLKSEIKTHVEKFLK